MKLSKIWRLAVLAAGLLANTCPSAAIEATHPTLKASSLPAMVPLRDFFISGSDSWYYQISPNGKKLAWFQRARRGVRLTIKSIDDGRITTIRLRRPGRNLRWARDNRHMIFFRDRAGDENTRLFVIDTEAPQATPRLLTPARDGKAWLNRLLANDPAHILIQMNHRDVSEFDLYRLNILTGESTILAQNPGDVLSWVTTPTGKIVARYRRGPNSELIIEVPYAASAASNSWQSLLTGETDDQHRIVAVSADGRYGWARSGIGRDKMAIVRLDLQTGKEETLHSEPTVDVESLYFDEAGEKPLMALSWPGYPKTQFFDRRFADDLAVFNTDTRAEILLLNYSDDLNRMVVRVRTDRANRAFYLFDRRTGEKTFLAKDAIGLHEEALSKMTPISFKARDGLQLHGYLTIPTGTNAKHLPMILKVHGGPASRDVWGYEQMTQFLANRGYAILYLDYRGSRGYGRAFRRAIRREYARKAHDDLIDGVNWAVRNGIADPKKIAIYGRSYGGYATLVGMTFTPDVFAAGIDIVGISDLVAKGIKSPPYWKLYHEGRENVGDRRNPDDLADMAARSPINFVDRIKNPLLVIHGANDVRVDRAHSDRMVAAMRRADKKVDYLLIENAGHKISNPRNRIMMARRIETFLAQHLGGRSETPLPVMIPANTLDYFVIENDADFPKEKVARVRAQLHAGLAALTVDGLAIHTDKFPITVRLRSGAGMSRSFHGAGPIILHFLERKRSPILHELTHMLAGYTRANGHWTQEGLASYMQDKYGEDKAFPTRNIPHALMKILMAENEILPMIRVMKDRDRTGVFGSSNRWERWIAYSQSSSFCKYLIETHGLKKFMAVYDKPFEKQNFQGAFGKPVESLVEDWLIMIRTVDRDLTASRNMYHRFNNFMR